MFPSASANTVLLEELVWCSIVFRKSARSFTLVRVTSWMRASIGFFMRLIEIHRSPCRAMTGPWRV